MIDKLEKYNQYFVISSEKSYGFLFKFLKKLYADKLIVFLSGNIGVGKTTFVKYLINFYEKKNKLKLSEVTSPTYNLLNEYHINKFQINHYDLYRVKHTNELNELNMFKDNSNIITLIEWPQLVETKPKHLIELNFQYDDDYKKRYVQTKGLILN